MPEPCAVVTSPELVPAHGRPFHTPVLCEAGLCVPCCPTQSKMAAMARFRSASTSDTALSKASWRWAVMT